MRHIAESEGPYADEQDEIDKFNAALHEFIRAGFALTDAWGDADERKPLPEHLKPPMSLDEWLMELQQHYAADETPEPRILNLDKIVDVLHMAGIAAYVEQTGGGCATIFVGEVKEVDGDPRYTVLAGPGWFEGPGWSNGRGQTDDFSVGPDDYGESDPVMTPVNANEADVAIEIMRQYRERS
jgi:hypothetical protein